MRAAAFSAFGGPEVLEIIDAPVPEPGPRQIRIAVRAAGVNPYDWKLRRGLMGGEPPKRVGLEVSGVVDALGAEVSDVAVGDRVFGFAIGGAMAQFTRSAHYARMPASLGWAEAAALPVAAETAVRTLDALGVSDGTTLLINGAGGAVGQAAVQLAIGRGARVIGTASEANHPLLAELGAQAVTYGTGLPDRVRALHPSPIDAALDAAGAGALPELIELTGSPGKVVSIADFAGAQATGVSFSATTSAYAALAQVAALIEAGDFALPVARTFTLEQLAEAQELSERGHAPGKLVVVL